MKTIQLSSFLVLVGALFALVGESAAAEYMKVTNLFQKKQQAELALAAEKGQTNKINALLQAGADVNSPGKDGMTVLLWCFLQQNKKGFTCLLEHGANPNLQMQDEAPTLGDLALAGTSVMSFAAMHRDTWYLETTLNHGGNPNLLNPVNSLAPIFETIYSIRPDQLKNMKILIAAGARLDVRNERGETPMIFAALHDRYDMAYALLEAGADPSLKDKNGHTIVYIINQFGRYFDIKSWRYPWYLKVIDALKAKGLDMEEGKAPK